MDTFAYKVRTSRPAHRTRRSFAASSVSSSAASHFLHQFHSSWTPIMASSAVAASPTTDSSRYDSLSTPLQKQSLLSEAMSSPYTTDLTTVFESEDDGQDRSRRRHRLQTPCSTPVESADGQIDDKMARNRSESCSSIQEDMDALAQSFRKRKFICYEDGTIGDSFLDQHACSCSAQPASDTTQSRARSCSPALRGPPPETEMASTDTPKERPLPQTEPAFLERLPLELLEDILVQLTLGPLPNEYTPRHRDLCSCLFVSKTLSRVALQVLLRQVSFHSSAGFAKFLGQIKNAPELGDRVRRLDLSHLSSLGLGRTARYTAQIDNFTATTLRRCLDATPGVQEVLLQEHVDGDIDQAVLEKIFYGLQDVRALDFCGAAAEPFATAFSAAMQPLELQPDRTFNLQHLSLHECFTLPDTIFETLLPRLPRLRILDLHHTRVTDTALCALPSSARLTHLNVGRCTSLTGAAVVKFLTSHPAAQGLIYLNLHSDLSRHRLLRVADLDALLPQITSSLRSLNLSGAPIGSAQLPSLRRLTSQLEELSVGYAQLSVAEILLLLQPLSRTPSPLTPCSDEEISTIPHSLHYLDLTGVASVTHSTLLGRGAALLAADAYPLTVLEVSDTVRTGLYKATAAARQWGWVAKECGRRGWLVRERRVPARSRSVAEGASLTSRSKDGSGRLYSDVIRHEAGRRDWKLGCASWGMRKVPVAWGEVGGLYGHYMFKK